MKHKVAGGGFSNNRVIEDVVHGFEKRSRHPPYNRGGARLQGIHRTLYSKWSSPIDWAYEGITDPILHA